MDVDRFERALCALVVVLLVVVCVAQLVHAASFDPRPDAWCVANGCV